MPCQIKMDKETKLKLYRSMVRIRTFENGCRKLIGEGKLKRKAAMVVARHGEGKVVLIGFRPQHRAQTHGTYKLVFNSLYG